LLAFLKEQDSVFVAINSPRGVNLGLVKNKIGEEHAGPRRIVRSSDIRLAEYELRER
jgi:hypothetical protein